MLFKQRFWPGLKDGSIKVAFRRWKRPSVKLGTQLKSPVGLLHIDAVELVSPTQISAEEAAAAGYDSLEQLLVEVNSYQGRLYRIKFHYAGPDPRLALREADELGEDELVKLHQRLQRLERKTDWTHRTLQLIRDNEGQRASDLALRLPMRARTYKIRVRQLKELGLTESLAIGYRISPRGRTYLDWLENRA